MKTPKRFFATLFIIALILSFTSLPAYAQSSVDFGDEQPFIFCTFTRNGELADGNKLTDGTYTVNVVLSEMEQNSVFQFTANYNFGEEYITSLDVTSTNADMSCGGVKDTGSALVVVLASEDESGNVLNGGQTTYVTMSVTIDTGSLATVDFRNCFRFDTNPDLTFVESDYDNGIEDAYVLNTSTETSYQTAKMIADESPSLSDDTYTVNGQITVAVDITGTQVVSYGVSGIDVTISSQTSDYEQTVETETNGAYSLEEVPEGEYTMTVSGPTTINRNVNLTVNDTKAEYGIIEADSVPVVITDYAKNGMVDISDLGEFYNYSNQQSELANIDGAGDADISDLGVFYIFFGKDIVYDDLTI